MPIREKGIGGAPSEPVGRQFRTAEPTRWAPNPTVVAPMSASWEGHRLEGCRDHFMGVGAEGQSGGASASLALLDPPMVSLVDNFPERPNVPLYRFPVFALQSLWRYVVTSVEVTSPDPM